MAQAQLEMEIEGIDKLIKTFNQLEKDIQNEIERIVKIGAELIKRNARANVARRTGLLASRIEVKTLEITQKFVKIGVGPVGDEVYYWYFVEYGTSKMAAQPYLRPAFDNNKKAVEKAIKVGIQRLISGVKY